MLNTVLSAGYYLKLLRLAFFEEPTDARPVAGGGYVALLAAGLLVLGLAWAVIV